MSSTNPIEDSVLHLLKCPVCEEPSQAPIFTCIAGHSICSDCRMKVENCPVCHIPGIPFVRNIALDTLSEQVLTVPCKFQSKGCGVKRKREEDFESHYKKCKFQFVYTCMAKKACDFVGSRHQVHEHVQKAHPDNVLSLRDIFICSFDTGNTGYKVMYKNEDMGEYFWICAKRIPNEKLVFYTLFVGPDEDAAMFRIHWEISSVDRKTTVLRFIKNSLKLNDDELLSGDAIVVDESFFGLDPVEGRQVHFTLNAVRKL